MPIHKRTLFTILMAATGFNGFAQTGSAERGLKDYYKSYFPVGVAITPGQLKDTAQRAFILRHFNSVTAENAMKMGPIHPRENSYYWKDADTIVNFAVHNGLRVRGHTLCWHNQTPDWLFRDSTGQQVSKEVLLERLKAHIYTVVGRYKGKVYAWDVVNEAVSDAPGEYLRNSLWYKICGEDFIVKAFEYAHQADPNAVLFYNDYNTEYPGKRDKIVRLLKSLREKGVPIHAVGLQGHWSVAGPSEKNLTEALHAYAATGVKVQITELDVSVYTDGNVQELADNKEAKGFTPERQNKQADVYQQFFKVFRENKNIVSGVTFWNLSDRYSWLDNFPVRGRKNYPLLFDENLQPKAAYQRVVSF